MTWLPITPVTYIPPLFGRAQMLDWPNFLAGFGWSGWHVPFAIYMARYWNALELFQTKTIEYFYSHLSKSSVPVTVPCMLVAQPAPSFSTSIFAGRVAVATYGGHLPMFFLPWSSHVTIYTSWMVWNSRASRNSLHNLESWSLRSKESTFYQVVETRSMDGNTWTNNESIPFCASKWNTWQFLVHL